MAARGLPPPASSSPWPLLTGGRAVHDRQRQKQQPLFYSTLGSSSPSSSSSCGSKSLPILPAVGMGLLGNCSSTSFHSASSTSHVALRVKDLAAMTTTARPFNQTDGFWHQTHGPRMSRTQFVAPLVCNSRTVARFRGHHTQYLPGRKPVEDVLLLSQPFIHRLRQLLGWSEKGAIASSSRACYKELQLDLAAGSTAPLQCTLCGASFTYASNWKDCWYHSGEEEVGLVVEDFTNGVMDVRWTCCGKGATYSVGINLPEAQTQDVPGCCCRKHVARVQPPAVAQGRRLPPPAMADVQAWSTF